MPLDHKRLARLRHAKGLSQRELARLVGMLQPALARLELGKYLNPKLDTLEKLAGALGATVSDLIG